MHSTQVKIFWNEGSRFFVLKFTLPPFPPLECKFKNKTTTEPFLPEYFLRVHSLLALGYLTEVLHKGLPLGILQNSQVSLKRLRSNGSHKTLSCFPAYKIARSSSTREPLKDRPPAPPFITLNFSFVWEPKVAARQSHQGLIP